MAIVESVFEAFVAGSMMNDIESTVDNQNGQPIFPVSVTTVSIDGTGRFDSE